MAKMKIVLAYSGGLDTSIILTWLKENYDCEVIAVCCDAGQKEDFAAIEAKALKTGADKCYIIDIKKEFVEEYIWPVLKAGAVYENAYLLGTSMARPLMAKKLVEIAEAEHAFYICHGCTGKGNDQVRFETTINALTPAIKVIAPWRIWDLHSREDLIQYAADHDIPIAQTIEKIYSRDENIWHISHEGGNLENPWNECPEEAFFMTTSIENAPDQAEFIELTFEKGIPVALNGKALPLYQLINDVNVIAGKHGIGRIDHVENRLVGIKSREIYECPGATVILKAHKDIEDITFVREVSHFKPVIENELSNTIYNGLWFNPATDALKAYIDSTQEVVNGTVKVKLYKGNAICIGRKSPNSLYDENLATYTAADEFDQDAAVGFIKLWGLPSQVNAQVWDKLNNEK